MPSIFSGNGFPVERAYKIGDVFETHVNVEWPDEQFCGDEHWVSSKIKRRIDNLNELGI